MVLNKDSSPYKSMLGEKSLGGRRSLFLREKVGTVLTTPSKLSESHFNRSRWSDKCGAVFRTIDDLPACFCMERCLCLEPILPVDTPVAGLWHSTCKPYFWSFTFAPVCEISIHVSGKSSEVRFCRCSNVSNVQQAGNDQLELDLGQEEVFFMAEKVGI